MQSLTIPEVARFFLEGDRFVIVTHRRPDGDTLGSGAALCLGLRRLGKTAHLLYNPEVTEKYRSLHDPLSKETVHPEDTLVSVDVASANMLPEAFAPFQARITLRIDHHKSAASFTPMELVDPAAAACGQIIYDILTQMGAELDIPTANALYTAISTDTGCFRYANTQAKTFSVAAACAAVSPDLPRLNRELFETNSLARLQIQSWITQNLRFFRGGQIALCVLPLAVEKALGVTEDDMENISGFPRSIAGVKIAATLRQQEDGLVKISVRAEPGYDAAAICSVFGGGGHAGAAGASLDMPLEDAAQAVIGAMPEI